MATKNKDLIIPKQTTKIFELQFKKNGQPINITEWVVYFTAKTAMKDTDDEAVIEKDIGNESGATSHSDPTNGKTLIELSPTDTNLEGNYYYDVKYKDGDRNIAIVVKGKIKFTRTVTTRG